MEGAECTAKLTPGFCRAVPVDGQGLVGIPNAIFQKDVKKEIRMKTGNSKYIQHNGGNLWDFEVFSDCCYENANHIHPLKQRDVSKLIEAVKSDEHIKEVIIFGSAVRFDCNSFSDLDVLLVRDDSELKIDGSLDRVESELDIIFSSKTGGRLKEEIAQTGVPVYWG